MGGGSRGSVVDGVGWIHTVAAVVAIVAGAATLFKRKGTRSHRFLGHMYLWSMVVLNATAFMIRDLWGGWGPFHVAALLSLLTVIVGMVPALRRKPEGSWLVHHAMWMAWSYAGLMAAFASEIATRVPAVPFVPGVVVGTLLVIGTAYYLINGGGGERVREAIRRAPDRFRSGASVLE